MVVPMILACTLYSSSYMTLYGAIVGVSACYVYLKTPRERKTRINMTQYVSWFRATVLLFTCICILAVDFKVFPRRFGKCEETGGLMDIGVGISGSPVVAFGGAGERRFVSLPNTSRAKRPVNFSRWDFCDWLYTAYSINITFRSGTHWNFFFTLASLIFLHPLPVSKFPLILGLITSFVGTFSTAMNGSSCYCSVRRFVDSNRRVFLELSDSWVSIVSPVSDRGLCGRRET